MHIEVEEWILSFMGITSRFMERARLIRREERLCLCSSISLIRISRYCQLRVFAKMRRLFIFCVALAGGRSLVGRRSVLPSHLSSDPWQSTFLHNTTP